ncbi:MAG: VCBS repeat-containing protein, partial [Acidobacteriota bacterium]|nr:VCBS repeat-containing protein [Acidobacteriota bacterium]
MARAAAGILVTVLGPPSAAALANQEYRDVAAEAGLSVVTGTGGPEKNHIAESTGTGVAVLDYDQDGLPDLYFPNAASWDDPQGAWRARSGVLYRNEGSRRFSDVTEAAGIVTDAYGQGAVSADFDGDGFPDLYVTALGPNLFFRNNGDGTFSEIGERAGVSDPGWSIGAVFLDADGDRTLDLFVANYIETDEPAIRGGRRTRRWRGRVPVLDGPRGLVPQANRFFRGRGNGAFEDATDSAGIGDVPARYSMGAVALDFDDDGDQDIFVANDSGPNDMLENRGGRFRDAGLFTGVALSADGATQGSMGVAAADADGDGFPDLVVTNFAHDHYAFYQGVGPSLFLEDAVGAGMATATFRPLGWGALFFDADNDGDLDV